jgi:tetratricopeptide (TPR) repeat protein
MSKTILIAVIFCLFIFSPIWAQYQGKVEGIVTDASGQPLSDVSVTITSITSGGASLELKTNKDGKFVQIGLRPAQYQITFKKEGFMTGTLEVRVRVADSREVKVQLEQAAGSVEGVFAKADKLFQKGNEHYEKLEYDLAIQKYQEAISQYDQQWAYFFNLGLAQKKSGDSQSAFDSFQKAVILNPDSFSCNKEMGEALALMEKFDEALPYYQKAIELNQDDPNAYFNYGVLQLKQGDSAAALESFTKVVELKPDYADAYYQLGTLHVGQNNKEEAIKSLEKFLELAPDHAQAPIAQQLLEYLKK